MKIYRNMIYLWIIIVSIVVGSLIVAFLAYDKPLNQNPPVAENQNILTYENQKFGYSIDYPSDWKFNEYTVIDTGGSFIPNEPSFDCVIKVEALFTIDSENNTPFEEYVRRAGIVEIEGYEKLNSIETITTVSGLVGYKTTWSGKRGITSPITYFENNKSFWVGGGTRQYKTVQVHVEGSNQDCEDVYNQMIKTFKTQTL